MLVYVNTLLSLGARIPVLCGGFAGNVNNSCMAWPKGALFLRFYNGLHVIFRHSIEEYCLF